MRTGYIVIDGIKHIPKLDMLDIGVHCNACSLQKECATDAQLLCCLYEPKGECHFEIA